MPTRGLRMQALEIFGNKLYLILMSILSFLKQFLPLDSGTPHSPSILVPRWPLFGLLCWLTLLYSIFKCQSSSRLF